MSRCYKIHIETTTRCNLRCSLCSRTRINRVSKIQLNDLHFESVYKLISWVHSKNLKIKIIFCGNFGDPIFHPSFLKILRSFKDKTVCQILITTNGSKKDDLFWNSLGNTLSIYDQIIFSIDGTNETTNSRYRKGGSYSTAIRNAKSLINISSCKVIRKTILFDYLIDSKDILIQSSNRIGFNSIIFAKTAREEFIRGSFDFINSNDKLREKTVKNCFFLNSDSFYLDATGIIYPCCWIAESMKLSDRSLFFDDLYLNSIKSELNIFENIIDFDEYLNHHKNLLISNINNSLTCYLKCFRLFRNKFETVKL